MFIVGVFIREKLPENYADTQKKSVKFAVNSTLFLLSDYDIIPKVIQFVKYKILLVLFTMYHTLHNHANSFKS